MLKNDILDAKIVKILLKFDKTRGSGEEESPHRGTRNACGLRGDTEFGAAASSCNSPGTSASSFLPRSSKPQLVATRWIM